MKTLVVTGGIGSGKTAVCRHLEELGLPVYYCDDRARDLYVEVPGLLDRVEQAAGVSARRADGSLDRAALAGAIFSDREKLLAVEALVHPLVYEDFVLWRAAREGGLVVMESAIFLQKPLFYPLANYVLYVAAPPEQIIRRVMRRDGVDRDAAERRFLAQETATDRLPDATVVNDGDLDTLYRRVDEYLKTIKI